MRSASSQSATPRSKLLQSPTSFETITLPTRTPTLPFSSPRSAYIHVPFCAHRCGYCNFTLITGRDDLIESCLEAIELELQLLSQPQEVDTLYFGGGTPTYLSPEQFSRLSRSVLRWHPLARDYEWTVEANPADLDHRTVENLANCGVNRLSLGAQSFQTQKLSLLERDHDAQQIARAVQLALKHGMKLSLDLIFAAPGETLSQWESDLEQALSLLPGHLSTYGLTFEPGTSFWTRRQQGALAPVAEQLQRDMYLSAIQRLSQAGFDHYEVSSFALPGQRSRHNQVYWTGAGYFAAGPGAARYVDGVRETNHRSTTTYLQRVLQGECPVAEREALDEDGRARELLVFGLRRLAGVSRETFAGRTGMDLDELVGRKIGQLVEAGLLLDEGDRVRLTTEGLLVSDSIWPELL